MKSAESGLSAARLSAAAFAGMFVFGIVMALLGAVLPALAQKLHFEVAETGNLFLAMNTAMLVCSLMLGAWMDRSGMKLPLAGGPLLVAAGLTGIATANSFNALLPAAALLGAGGAAVNSASNTLIADIHTDPSRKNSALNLLGVFFGFGALLLPMGLGAVVRQMGSGPVLLAGAALCAVAGLFSALPHYPAPKQQEHLPASELKLLLRQPLLLTAGVLLFFESGVEFTIGGYLTTFLTREIGVSIAAASWILAGYWASLMLSRVVLSRVLLRVDPRRVVLGCAVGAAVSAGLAAASHDVWAAAVALLAAGWTLAGIFPTTLGILGAAFGPRSGTVFGIVIAMALCGGISLPWTSAHLAQAFGLRYVLGLVAGCFCAIAALSRLLVYRPDPWTTECG